MTSDAPKPHGEQVEPADEPDPLDIAQDFVPATSYEVRDELADLVRRDLLGPWEGEHEQFAPRAMGPRERYLVGMLGPKHAPKSARDEADEVPDTESGVQGDGEAELPEVVTPQNLGRIWASSMGLSCAVHADVDALHVTVSWGRYAKRETEDDRCRAWLDSMPELAMTTGDALQVPAVSLDNLDHLADLDRHAEDGMGDHRQFPLVAAFAVLTVDQAR